MKKVFVKSSEIKKSRNLISGKFNLSDGTVTKFCCQSGLTWEQWGNTRENLGLTVDLVENYQLEIEGIR